MKRIKIANNFHKNSSKILLGIVQIEEKSNYENFHGNFSKNSKFKQINIL